MLRTMLSAILSGMSASRLRMGVSAHNVANVGTPGFHPSRVEQQPSPGGGVSARAQQSRQRGVNYAEERIEQAAASRTYSAQLKVARAEDEILGTLMDMIT